MKTIDSIKLAHYIIDELNSKFEDINHLKVQKLLYYVDSWHLVFTGHKLISDDFEAWVHGPVSRKVFLEFKEHSLIYDVIKPFNEKISLEAEGLAKEQIEIISDVLEEYGDKTPYHLECLTHDEKPWKEARGSCVDSEVCTNIMNQETIKTFYASLLNE